MQDLETSCVEQFPRSATGKSTCSRPEWMNRCHQEATVLPCASMEQTLNEEEKEAKEKAKTGKEKRITNVKIKNVTKN